MPALLGSMTSAPRCLARASAMGLRHELPMQTNRVRTGLFELAPFMLSKPALTRQPWREIARGLAYPKSVRGGRWPPDGCLAPPGSDRSDAGAARCRRGQPGE